MKISQMSKLRMRRDIGKQTLSGIIRTAIDGIRKTGNDPDDWKSPLMVKAFIHSVVLSGSRGNNECYIDKVRTHIGDFHQDMLFFPSKRMPHYKAKWIRHTKKY